MLTRIFSLRKAFVDAIGSEIPQKLTSKVLLWKDLMLTVWMMIEASVSYKSGSHLKVGHFPLLSDLTVMVSMMI